MDNLWRRGAPRRYKSNHQIFKFSNRKSSLVNRKYYCIFALSKIDKLIQWKK